MIDRELEAEIQSVRASGSSEECFRLSCENKPKRKQRADMYSIGLAIPMDLYRRLKSVADKEGRSISNMTRRMIEDYLDHCGG